MDKLESDKEIIENYVAKVVKEKGLTKKLASIFINGVQLGVKIAAAINNDNLEKLK